MFGSSEGQAFCILKIIFKQKRVFILFLLGITRDHGIKFPVGLIRLREKLFRENVKIVGHVNLVSV